MEVRNEAELRVLNKMEALNFPRSVTTTVMWATRKAPNSTEALREVELLVDQKPTGKEMTRAVQKYLRPWAEQMKQAAREP